MALARLPFVVVLVHESARPLGASTPPRLDLWLGLHPLRFGCAPLGRRRVSRGDERVAERIRAFRAGDANALSDLIELIRPRLLRMADAIVRDKSLAEDVFVDAMTDLLPRLMDFEHPEAFSVYALRATRTQALDMLRRRDHRDSVLALRATGDVGAGDPSRSTAPIERLGGVSDPETRALGEERREHIWSEVARLAEPGRTIVERIFRDGESCDSVADALGISRRSAYRHLQVARGLLAARLADSFGRFIGAVPDPLAEDGTTPAASRSDRGGRHEQ